MNLTQRITEEIYQIFREYDMHRGFNNEIRRKNILDLCIKDLETNPEIKESLTTENQIHNYIMQTIISMI